MKRINSQYLDAVSCDFGSELREHLQIKLWYGNMHARSLVGINEYRGLEMLDIVHHQPSGGGRTMVPVLSKVWPVDTRASSEIRKNVGNVPHSVATECIACREHED
jgi:hypothetical protein